MTDPAADRYDHVDEEVELVVEDTELPRRLKDQVYETIEDREGVTTEEADEIAQATESRYVDTRVDPLDPVGTVSAQSIGEPGTQMSIPHDERVVVRRGGQTDVTAIGPLVDEIVASNESRTVDDHEVALAPDSLEVPSLRPDGTLTWKTVEEVSRHDAPAELLEFELASGRSVRATKAHSFVVERDDEIVPIRGDELEVGAELPVTGEFDSETDSVGLDAFETVATDGAGAVAVPETDEIRGDVDWDRITNIRTVETEYDYVYDFSVAGLETFTTAEGVVTHNTMNTFHFAGVAEMDVTQGLPRLIELVDARKEPDTPVMVVRLEGEYAENREKAHEVVWQIEATKILALGDVSTNVADMRVSVDLNEETLLERWPTHDDATEVAGMIAETIESNLGVETVQRGTVVQFGPDEPSYRELLQLVEQLREITFKGIEEVSRVVIRKEEAEDGGDEEFVLYTEGSAFSDALEIEGVDASRTTCNNIHEIYRTLGVEAARESIIDETMDTLEEQGLGDVNVRHLMLVADIMTNQGTVESIGRHGISGSKESVLARAAFEVTVNHLLDAAIQGEVDDLDGVIENVIAGKPVAIGTGDVDLRMGSTGDVTQPSADD